MLTDDSKPNGVSIMATLWDELSEDKFEIGEIIAIKSARVSTYGGFSLNVNAE